LHKASSSVALPVKEMGEPNLDLSMRLAQQSQLRLLEVNNRAKEEICWDLAVYTVIFLGLLPNRYSLCLGKTRG